MTDAADLLASGFMVAGSGSAGDQTLSQNSSGLYIRERVTPIDPASGLQVGRRNAMVFLWGRWLSSSPARMKGWGLYGRTDVRRNRAGYSYHLTGWQAFVAVNFARFMSALPILLVAPAFHRADVLQPVTIAVQTLAPRLTVSFDESDAWVTDRRGALLVFGSASHSNQINWFRGPYRSAGRIRGNDTTPPTSPFSLGAGGFFLSPGDHWFGRVYTTRGNGSLSPVQFLGPTVIQA